jgi:hypothetical protein
MISDAPLPQFAIRVLLVQFTTDIVYVLTLLSDFSLVGDGNAVNEARKSASSVCAF